MKAETLCRSAALVLLFLGWCTHDRLLPAADSTARAGWLHSNSQRATPGTTANMGAERANRRVAMRQVPAGAAQPRPTSASGAPSTDTAPGSTTMAPASPPVAGVEPGPESNAWTAPMPATVDSDCGDCCELETGCRPGGMFYGGAEYLLTRPRFSQAVFAVQRTTNVDAQNLINTFSDRSVDYAMNYDSSFRALLGYHLCGCGGDIQFTYWRLTANSQMSTGIANFFSNPGMIIAGQLEINPNDPVGPTTPNGANPTADNEALTGSLHLAQNTYDLDFSKCIPLGGSCGDCDACGCPAWELRWMAGARATNMARLEENAAAIPGQTASKTGEIFTRFAGGGPRIGILGRRYVGQSGRLSLFAKGNQSLLLGTTNITRRRITAPTSPLNPVIIDEHQSSFARAVPCTEIEVGGGLQISPHAFLSAGWFVQAWWDLGMPEQPDGTNFGPLSSANILAWDGLFVRGEFVY